MSFTDPDYFPPIEATVDVEKPIRSEQGFAFFGNLIAAFPGKLGAPRLWLPALERLEAGTQIRSRIDAPLNVTAINTTTVRHRFGFIQHGQIRVTFTLAVVNIVNGQIVRERNGADTTIFSSNTSGTFSADVDVLPGDEVRIELVIGAVGDGTISDCRFQTNGQDLWPGVAVRLEGNRAAP
jgi:hypothetical protein